MHDQINQILKLGHVKSQITENYVRFMRRCMHVNEARSVCVNPELCCVFAQWLNYVIPSYLSNTDIKVRYL